MRIRSIKPEFWRSDDIDALDWETRLVFIGLWSYVDDNGVGIYKMANIVSDLFAHDFYRDPNATLSRVSEALTHLESRSMIDLYKVDDREYIYITNWERHQRVNNPNKPRYPLPTSENADPIEDLSRTDSGSREGVPPGAGEQRNRGTGEQRSSKPRERGGYSPDFETFWATYPRKEAKRQAWKAWGKAIERATPERITAGASRYAADPNRSDQFTKHGSTWLNADGWDDEPLPAPSGRDNTHAAWSTPKGYDPADWLRKPDEPSFDYIDAEVVQLREIGR